ncbi:MAG TPA: ECF transporter S component [Actinomycetota bacterium]|nr:ECF transporter S component [Actinomycetota bacterium]
MRTLDRSETHRPVRLPGEARAPWALVAINAAGLCAFLWPLFIGAGRTTAEGRAHTTDAPVLVALALPLIGVVALQEARRHRTDARLVALLGALVAVSAFMRLPKGPSGEGFALVLPILAGWSLGSRFGFLLGSLTIVVSAVLTAGVGPWMPFQMFAAGWVGAGAGLARRATGGRLATLTLGAYAAVACVVFGGLMTLWFWPFLASGTAAAFEPGLGAAETVRRYIAFYAISSLGWDVGRALLGTVPLVVVLARPVGRLLDRAAARLGQTSAPM